MAQEDAGAGELKPLFSIADRACSNCWTCARLCPAKALSVVDGRGVRDTERCVRCGVCVAQCGSRAVRPRNDTAAVRSLIASGRPVVALLASEYLAALYPMNAEQIEHAVIALGFTGIETSVLGEELVAAEYERAHARTDSLLPQLRSTCTVAVEWVRKFHPQLTGALEPVVPPYIAQARLIRSLYPEDVAIVYVSPCWARKDEILEEAFAGLVDVVIGFDELHEMVASRVSTPSLMESDAAVPLVASAKAVKELSATDGFPRRTLSRHDMANRDLITVRGLEDIDKLLVAITRGETGPRVVDMLACEGCIDGPCVNPDMTVYAKRSIDAAERERQAPPPVTSKQLLSVLPRIELHRSFTPTPVTTRQPSAEEIDAVLAAAEFASRSDQLDCGACGYGTCAGHAAAICRGISSWEVCLPLQRRQIASERDRLKAAITFDDLTGLLNRRGFDERLHAEVGRAKRYGHPLSMIMMDLDGFKDINDKHGHAAGDAVLRAFGVLAKTVLRASDIAARYGGDEFAIILPGVGKTEAWAVAEKVRSSLRDMAVPVAGDFTVRTSGSAGVASLGEGCDDAQALSSAADTALYAAKRSGKDRVELAAG